MALTAETDHEERLCDPGSSVELQPFRRSGSAAYGDTGSAADGDGVVAGTGTVAGRPVAVMVPEASVGLLHRRHLAGAADSAARRHQFAAEYPAAVAHPFLAAGNGIVDEVVLPEESRVRMQAALHLLLSKGAH